MAEHLRITHDGTVATVTMARPEVHNAFNEALISELHAAFAELGADAGVRVIVLAGEGKSFSAGADLDWMRRMASASEAENRADAERLAAMLRAVAECPKPVVARVHGAAIGGGAGLVAACDVALAVDGVWFGFTEVRLGLVPATIAPYVIDKIGPGQALLRFLSGDLFDALLAQEIGLIDLAVDEENFDDLVDGWVEELVQGGPQALAACKRLVRTVVSLPREKVDAYTSELIAKIRASEEGREGVAAFLEKRNASWIAKVGAYRRDISTKAKGKRRE